MILEQQYGKVYSLASLRLDAVEDLPKSDEQWDPVMPCVDWKFKEGLVPEADEWGLVYLKCYQIKDGGVVRNSSTGRPVMKPFSVPYDYLVAPNPRPSENRPGQKVGPPAPMRKLEDWEDILPDFANTFMVVDLRTKKETEDQEEDRQTDEILTLVKENNALLKQLKEAL